MKTPESTPVDNDANLENDRARAEEMAIAGDLDRTEEAEQKKKSSTLGGKLRGLIGSDLFDHADLASISANEKEEDAGRIYDLQRELQGMNNDELEKFVRAFWKEGMSNPSIQTHDWHLKRRALLQMVKERKMSWVNCIR
ncbi:MAG: hypothetical protein AAB690_00600 [Patescibacteria group bacterium]